MKCRLRGRNNYSLDSMFYHGTPLERVHAHTKHTFSKKTHQNSAQKNTQEMEHYVSDPAAFSLISLAVVNQSEIPLVKLFSV